MLNIMGNFSEPVFLYVCTLLTYARSISGGCMWALQPGWWSSRLATERTRSRNPCWCIALILRRQFLYPFACFLEWSSHTEILCENTPSGKPYRHFCVLYSESASFTAGRHSQFSWLIFHYDYLKNDSITFHYNMNNFLKPPKPLMHDKLILISSWIPPCNCARSR